MPRIAEFQYDSDSNDDRPPELVSGSDEEAKDKNDGDDVQPLPPPSPPMATSCKLFRDDQRLTRSMAHVAKFNIPDIAFPPATDDDVSPAPAAVTLTPPIDPTSMSQDDTPGKLRRRAPRITLSRRQTNYVQRAEHEDTDPKAPYIARHPHSGPSLIVDAGMWLAGHEEHLIFNFAKERRAIFAQDPSDKENLTVAAFENMATVFEIHRPHRASDRIHRPDYVAGDDHDHPGDM